MGKIRAAALRQKSKSELEQQLVELKTELAQLRVAQTAGAAASKLAKIGSVRKAIARVKTVYSQTQREKLLARAKAEKTKYLPIDLRAKKTRAIRRRLSPKHAAAKTTRQAKRDANYPVRRYAVKA